MKRRQSPDDLPQELIRFEGFRYRTAVAWEAAFDQFCSGREEWAAGRGVNVLVPLEIDGECPFDRSAV